MEKAKATIDIYPLERRKIVKKTIVKLYNILILFVLLDLSAVIFFTQYLSSLWLPELIVFVLLVPIIYFYESAYYKKYYYDIGPEFLVIKKGVFAPRETTLPYDKMQDVYLDQDIFDRIFSLWDLHVSTATYLSGWEAHIDGVSRENGETMKRMILEKIQESKRK